MTRPKRHQMEARMAKLAKLAKTARLFVFSFSHTYICQTGLQDPFSKWKYAWPGQLGQLRQ